MDAIAKEPRRRAPQRHWGWFAPWAVAAALAIVAGVLWTKNAALERQMASIQNSFSEQQQELASAREVVATLTAPESQQVTLVAAKTPPLPHGKAFYLRSTGSLIFLASNLPPLPAEKIYELWLIPTSGNPVAAGLFRPDSHGGAAVLNPPLSPGLDAKTFAVTLEPVTGSHEAPRGQAVIVGAGE
jgi:anti-sigma-K factor RskA